MTFMECMEFLCKYVDISPTFLTVNVRLSFKFAKNLKLESPDEPLSPCHIATLHIYTQQTPLYVKMNTQLSVDRSPESLAPWMPYVKLLMSALYHLPPKAATVYRGVRLDIVKNYLPKGKEKTWYYFYLVRQ